MPKMVYDSLKLNNMVDYPFYHSHADGTISKILGRVNVQVRIQNKLVPIDFVVLSRSQRNIVLGRSFQNKLVPIDFVVLSTRTDAMKITIYFAYRVCFR